MVDEYVTSLPVRVIWLGRKGVHKQIHIGMRQRDAGTDFVKPFLQMVRDRQSGSRHIAGALSSYSVRRLESIPE